MRDAKRIESAKGNRFKPTQPTSGPGIFRSGPAPMELNATTATITKTHPRGTSEMPKRKTVLTLQRERTHGTRLPKKRQAELLRPTKPPALVPESGPISSDTARSSPLLNTTLSSAFETPHLGLLVAKGFVNSAPCKILFDNGAEISYLSNRLAKHLQVETKEANQHATFADGTSTSLHQTVVPVNLRVEGYTESISLAVCSLSLFLRCHPRKTMALQIRPNNITQNE
jgi:Putative peptidase (DUF1758)